MQYTKYEVPNFDLIPSFQKQPEIFDTDITIDDLLLRSLRKLDISTTNFSILTLCPYIMDWRRIIS